MPVTASLSTKHLSPHGRRWLERNWDDDGKGGWIVPIDAADEYEDYLPVMLARVLEYVAREHVEVTHIHFTPDGDVWPEIPKFERERT